MQEQVRMAEYDFKKIEKRFLELYPLLKQPGMYRPAKNDRTILTPGQVLALFNDETDIDHLIGAAVYITGKRLSDIYKDERFSSDELPEIVNQHFNLAQLILLHHSNRIPNLLADNVDAMEEKRGMCLQLLADAEDGGAVQWTEYAYWLTGRAEKADEAEKAEDAKLFYDAAEKYLRQAHKAGYAEATESLATFLYTKNDEAGEPTMLWQQAALKGNVLAIQHLFALVVGDDSMPEADRNESLTCMWRGINANKAETQNVAKSLRRAGFKMDPKALIPA